MTRIEQERAALIGLGSNLGDRQATLSAAVAMLREHDRISDVTTSSLYETDPVGVLAQPKFLNAVVAIKTRLAPEALLETLMQIEAEFGRERRERWGPRTLDLDLLAFEGEKRDTEKLTLPHPRMFERTFVIVPLRELLAKLPQSSAVEWNDLRDRLTGFQVKPEEVRWWSEPKTLGPIDR